MLNATALFRRHLMLGCAGLALGMAVTAARPVLAQTGEDVDVTAGEDVPAVLPDAEDSETEQMVIRGFRASVQNAIENKRRADTVIESITAEDIGRLPDISIAEALARLPGISSQRVSGQSSAINIRGLSQSLTFSTLNGREQVTPNGNRSIEFEQFPSELISGADVYKSPKASLIEGGLAGTVELKTVRPLERNGRTFNVNARGIFNDRADEIFDADEFGYRVSLSYVDQFLNDTLGIAFGYARLEQPNVATRFVGFDYQRGSFSTDENGNPVPNRDFNADGQPDNVTFGFETEEAGGTDIRDGLIGTVQWQPTDTFTLEIDAYYSTFDTEEIGRGIRVIGPQEVPGNTTVTDPIFAGNAIVGGTFRRNTGAPTAGGGFGLTFQGINDNNRDEDELFSFGSQAEFQNDRIRVMVDVTYSRADSLFVNEVSAILPIASFDGVPGVSNDAPATPVISTDQEVFYQLNGTDIPTIEFANDFTDRSLYRLARFGAFPFENEDELFALEGEVEYFLEDDPFFRSIEMGVRYSSREATQRRTSNDFGNDAGFFQFAQNFFDPIALDDSNSSVECFAGDFADAGFPCYLVVPDPRAVLEGVVGPITLNQDQGFTRSESFIIEEDIWAGYVQGNIETTLFGIDVLGNMGIRIVQTNQLSVNQLATEDPTSPLASGGEQNFIRVLPAGNLVLLLTERDQLRIGASRAIARPPLLDLGSGVNVSIDSGGFPTGGGSGNPFLLPFLSNNVDLSYERYFDNGGIFTVAAFYKDLVNFIVDQNNPVFDFEEAGFLPVLQAEPNFGQLDTFVGPFGGPLNGEGGYIWGIEVAYSQVFDFLPAPFDGFGVIVNYSYTDSVIDFVAGESGIDITLPLPGLSDHVFNGTIYYEKGGFSNRLGLRYRSEFVSPQIGVNAQLPLTAAELVLDYQAAYDFSPESSLAGLTLLFQVNNLTDEPVTTFFGQEAQTGTLQNFGRTFFLGASYTY
ncbi:MAG: TonB-dependent receptor [Alphaproteobacteria bacterium]